MKLNKPKTMAPKARARMRMWHYTNGQESLFDLDKTELKIFEALCNAAESEK